jgi:hypothetical protein
VTESSFWNAVEMKYFSYLKTVRGVYPQVDKAKKAPGGNKNNMH